MEEFVDTQVRVVQAVEAVSNSVILVTSNHKKPALWWLLVMWQLPVQLPNLRR